MVPMRLADRLLAHGLVRAKCNHDIERRHGSADPVENAFEKNAQRARPGRVRDDQEDSFSAIFGGRTSFVNHLEHLLASEGVRSKRRVLTLDIEVSRNCTQSFS